MDLQTAREEYALALKQGQKEYKELLSQGRDPYPQVLDKLVPDNASLSVQEVGTLEIPMERIVGTKSEGRIYAFSAGFLPMLSADSEFRMKWISLCRAHLGNEGIREPILCYEYLGNFYVQEGNKRVSVMRHFGAVRIPGVVKRLLPAKSDDPRIKAYYEFLDFYKVSRIYTVQFRRPGDYARLLKALGKKWDEVWTDQERRTFNAYFHYFTEAFRSLKESLEDILPEGTAIDASEGISLITPEEHHHHHEHGEECTCGCHDHEHHHADEVFTSFGVETANRYTIEQIESILSSFDEMSVGLVLRAKGIVESVSGEWIYFDYVPGEVNVRIGSSDVIGKICVIGSQINNSKIEELFKL